MRRDWPRNGDSLALASLLATSRDDEVPVWAASGSSMRRQRTQPVAARIAAGRLGRRLALGARDSCRHPKEGTRLRETRPLRYGTPLVIVQVVLLGWD